MRKVTNDIECLIVFVNEHVLSLVLLKTFNNLPSVPHKAVAEVLTIGNL